MASRAAFSNRHYALHIMNLRLEADGEKEPTLCSCCGNPTRTVWGYIYDEDNAFAAYFVQWTSGNKASDNKTGGGTKHNSNFDFIVGTWGDDSIEDKKLLSWVYNATHQTGGSYMAIDAQNRPAAESTLCNVALTREEIVNDWNLMEISKQLLDVVWANEPRIDEIRNFGQSDT